MIHTEYSDFTLKWAETDWESQQARAIRRAVFCEEQRLFDQDDTDDKDAQAFTLVAIGALGGYHEQVVGTVRLYQSAEGEWWGSRLALRPEFRSELQLGRALIKLAVCSANTLGCHCFKATVQQRNVTLFKRLHWQEQHRLEVAGQPHVLMQADLTAYPRFEHQPMRFVVKARRKRRTHELLPALLHNTPHGRGGSSYAA